MTPSHPAWCDAGRCGHVVPPVLTHLRRRHRGRLHRIGNVGSGTLIAAYLVSGDGPRPLVALHVASRGQGRGWVELPLGQVSALAHRLVALLGEAGSGDGYADGRE